MTATTVKLGEPTRCRSCDALILWAKSSKSDKLVPLDLDPVAGGNILLEDGVATVLTKKQLASIGDGALHKSHFATCPQAPQWRNRG